jgi:hypothetical protein
MQMELVGDTTTPVATMIRNLYRTGAIRFKTADGKQVVLS